jgi:hypothetical protein
VTVAQEPAALARIEEPPPVRHEHVVGSRLGVGPGELVQAEGMPPLGGEPRDVVFGPVLTLLDEEPPAAFLMSWFKVDEVVVTRCRLRQ